MLTRKSQTEHNPLQGSPAAGNVHSGKSAQLWGAGD